MSICVFGEALIDLLDQGNNAFAAHLGGSPYNVAIGLARQGTAVRYLSPLSDDRFGQQLHTSLTRAGVDLPAQARSPRPTSIALVVIDDDGQPSYRLYRDGVADTDTSLDHLLAALPPDATVLHTGSLVLTPDLHPLMRQLFAELNSRGILISVDINIRLGVCVDTQSYLDSVRALLPYCDLVKGSDEDFAHLAPDTSPRLAARAVLKRMKRGVVALTRGANGAELLSANTHIVDSGVPATRVVDTVGAGDTFQACLLAATHTAAVADGGWDRLGDEILAPALRRACAGAAINVARAGCAPPTAAELDAALAAGC